MWIERHRRGRGNASPARRGGRGALVPVAAALVLGVLAAVPLGGAEESRRIQRVTVVDAGGEQVALYRESHALLVGVSRYTGGWPSLESIPEELEAVRGVLVEQGFEVRTVLDPRADELTGAFQELIRDHGYDRDNRLLFYFSGHGHTRNKGKKGYLVPAEAPDPRLDEKGFLRTALPMSQVVAWAKTIEAKHALFVFDSCFSGTIFKSKSLPTHPPHIAKSLLQPVRQFITAGSAGEEVPAKSVFSPSLVRGLRGAADLNADGYVVGTELGLYLRDTVLAYEVGQTPQFGKLKDPDWDEGDYVFQLPPVPAPPSVPESSVTYLERMEQSRARWGEYQTEIESAYDEIFEIDESPYFLAVEKAAAWRSFLLAFAEDNPFSQHDEHIRATARTRLDQLDSAAADVALLPEEENGDGDASGDGGALEIGEIRIADVNPEAAGEWLPVPALELGGGEPVLSFRAGRHYTRLGIRPEIRPCDPDRHPLANWASRNQQACWELVPFVEGVDDGERLCFYRAGGGYVPMQDGVQNGEERLLRIYAFTTREETLSGVEAFRFPECIHEIRGSWAEVRPLNCLVFAAGRRYREARGCGADEICVFFDRDY